MAKLTERYLQDCAFKQLGKYYKAKNLMLKFLLGLRL